MTATTTYTKNLTVPKVKEDPLFFLVVGGVGGGSKYATTKIWQSLRHKGLVRRLDDAVQGFSKASDSIGPAAEGYAANAIQAVGALRAVLRGMGVRVPTKVPSLMDVRNWIFRNARK